MVGFTDLDARLEQLLGLFETHLGVKAATLDKAVARAGRRLPKQLRRKAEVLIAAEANAGNPILMRQVNQAALETAYQDLQRHLQANDLKEQRRTRQLNMLAGIAFNLLLVLVAFLAWLWWQGQP